MDFAIVGASAADLFSTEYALHQNPYAYEANPLLREPLPRYAFKVVGTVLVISARHELKKKGHHKAAKILGLGAVFFWSGLAVNNVIKARQ